MKEVIRDTRISLFTKLCIFILIHFLSDLSCDFQRSLPSILSGDGELGGLVDEAAGLLEPRPRSLDLQPQNQHKPVTTRSFSLEIQTSQRNLWVFFF